MDSDWTWVDTKLLLGLVASLAGLGLEAVFAWRFVRGLMA